MRDYCIITINSGSPSELEATYNEQFLAEFKKQVPYPFRHYESGRIWKFDCAYLEKIKDLALQYFDRCYLLEGSITTNLRTGETEDPIFYRE